MNLTTRILNPVVHAIRISDGLKGGTLGRVYHHCKQIDNLYLGDIDGLDEDVRDKICNLWKARWAYFHEPVMTASYMSTPHFMRENFSSKEVNEYKHVLRKMATPEHSYPAILTEWQAFRTLAEGKTGDFTDEMAFCDSALNVPAHEWISSWLSEFPHFSWAACRLASIVASASGAEHSYSIEGWIHSKRRNRLGQTVVERLLRAHTNLCLKAGFEDTLRTVLPWGVELVIEEPEDWV